MKIGVYCRVSSEKQSDNTSLQSQRKLGIQFCERMGYEYEVFSEVESGTIDGYLRDEFKKLEEKLYSKELEGIWLWDWDRMIRELGVAVIFRDLIESTKCRLFVGNSEKDIFSDSGSLEFGIGSVFSEYWRRKIGRVMKGGMKERLLKDEVFMGVVPIGYKKVNKKLIVNKKESKIIKECFKIYLYKSVKTYRDVVNRMKNKYGEDLDVRINDKSLSRILKDEKYKGIYNLNWEGDDYQLNIGRIIEDDVFEKVGKKIESVKGLRRGNIKNKYLLKGKVYCKDCGNRMWIRGGGYETSVAKVYRYYFCKERYKQIRKNYDDRFENTYIPLCECIKENKISVSKLDDIVWDTLFTVLSNSNQIKEEYKKKYTNDSNSKNRFGGKKKYYENQLNKIDSLEENTLTKFVSGEIDERQNNILSVKFEKDRVEINNKLTEIKEEYEKYEVGEVVTNYIDIMMEELERQHSIMRHSDREVIINKYIEEVKVKYIGDERKNYRIEIKLSLKDDFEDLIKGINSKSKENTNKNKGNEIYISNHRSLQICDLIYKDYLLINFVVDVEIWGMGMGYDIDNVDIIEVY